MTQMNNPVNRDRAHRTWLRQAQWQRRLYTWLISGGAATLIAAAFLTLVMFIASNMTPVARAQAQGQITPIDLSGDHPHLFDFHKMAGNDATVALYGTATGGILDIPAAGTTPAHQDAALFIDPTCSISAKSLVGVVIHIDLSQAAIIDDQTQHIYLVGAPTVGAHSAFFWEIAATGSIQVSELPFGQGDQITANVLVTRFTRGDIPVESYQLILTLEIHGEGSLTCTVTDP